jgi:hypothetical protein
MAQAQRYKLTLSKLDFISLVDDPAQPNATTLLIKRKGAKLEGETQARFVKAADELGLAFFWAFTSTEKNGTAHYDHHGDAVQADDAMVKAAMDFMLDAGGAVDEMHDYEQKSRVVFAMPMTKEIASSFGIQTERTGLMIAIKVSGEQLAKLKSGEYTGVSIAGLGTREPVEARKDLAGARTKLQAAIARHERHMDGSEETSDESQMRMMNEMKAALAELTDVTEARKSSDKRYFTDEVLGHQHEVNVFNGGDPWMTDATAEGSQSPHRHTVSRGADGALTVLADSGHTHTLTEQPKVVVVSDDTAVVSEAVAARAPHSPTGESPRPIAATTVKTLQEPSKMTTDAKISELEKTLGLISKLSTTEHALWKSLPADEAAAFLTKSVGDRAPMLAEFAKRDEVVYTADDGAVYRKSADANLVAMAKRLDESERARKDVDVAKRAGDMFGAAKPEDGSHVELVKAIDAIGDGTKREGVTKLVGQLIATSRIGKSAPGSDAGAETAEQTATEQLDALTTEYATKNNVDRPTARVAVMKTADGKRLYAESVGRA